VLKIFDKVFSQTIGKFNGWDGVVSGQQLEE
jgi:hypothetical protein